MRLLDSPKTRVDLPSRRAFGRLAICRMVAVGSFPEKDSFRGFLQIQALFARLCACMHTATRTETYLRGLRELSEGPERVGTGKVWEPRVRRVGRGNWLHPKLSFVLNNPWVGGSGV